MGTRRTRVSKSRRWRRRLRLRVVVRLRLRPPQRAALLCKSRIGGIARAHVVAVAANSGGAAAAQGQEEEAAAWILTTVVMPITPVTPITVVGMALRAMGLQTMAMALMGQIIMSMARRCPPRTMITSLKRSLQHPKLTATKASNQSNTLIIMRKALVAGRHSTRMPQGIRAAIPRLITPSKRSQRAGVQRQRRHAKPRQNGHRPSPLRPPRSAPPR